MSGKDESLMVSAETWDEIDFEERYKFYAQRFGFAGKELVRGFPYDDLELGAPNPEEIVHDDMEDETMTEALYAANMKEFELKQKAYEEEMKRREAMPQAAAVPRRPVPPIKEIKYVTVAKLRRVARKEEFRFESEQFRKNKMKYEKDCQELCGDLMMKLEKTLRISVTQDKDYQSAMTSSNVTNLWAIVKGCVKGKGEHTVFIVLLKTVKLKQKTDSLNGLAEYIKEFKENKADVMKIGSEKEIMEKLWNVKFIEGLIQDGMFKDAITQARSGSVWDSHEKLADLLLRMATTQKGIEEVQRLEKKEGLIIDLTKSKFTGPCFNCGASPANHPRALCPMPKSLCNICKRYGHLAEYCLDKRERKFEEKKFGTKNDERLRNNDKVVKFSYKDKKRYEKRGKRDFRKGKGVKINVTNTFDQDDDENDEDVDDFDELEDNSVNTMSTSCMKIQEPEGVIEVNRVKETSGERFVIDSACVGTAHVVNSASMLKKLLDTSIQISGYDGKKTTVNTIGEVENIGKAVFIQDAPNNLVNLIKLCEDIGGHYKGDANEMKIYDRNHDLFAKATRDKDGFLSFSYADLVQKKELKVSTVFINNSKHYSMEERLRAQEAFGLCALLGHPGDVGLFRALETSSFQNCPLVPQDLINAREIFGRCPACVEGKIKAPSEKPSTTPPASKIGEKLFGDLVFFNGPTIGGYIGAVFIVDEKSAMSFIAGITSKSKTNVLSAIDSALAQFNAYSHKVEQMVFDDENVNKSLKSELAKRGIRLSTTPAELHNKRCERYIQTFKRRYESARASLPYELPNELQYELALFIVEQMNATPNSVTGSVTPCFTFTGQRPIIPLHEFGKTGIFYSKRQDSPKQRGEWGIFIAHRYNGINNLKAYFPFRRGIYSRRKFVPFDIFPKEWGFQPRLKPTNLIKTPNSLPEFNAKSLNELEGQRKSLSVDPIDEDSPLQTSSSGPVKISSNPIDWKGDVSEYGRSKDSKGGDTGKTETLPKPRHFEAPVEYMAPPNHIISEPNIEILTEMPQRHTEIAQTTEKLGNQSRFDDKVNEPNSIPTPQLQNATPPAATESKRPKRQASMHNWKHGPAKDRGYSTNNINRISLGQALKDKGKMQLTVDAINTELKNLVDNKALSPINYQDIPPGSYGNIINSHLFLKDKHLSNGDFEKRKGRMALNGNEENPDEIGETKSPTVNPISLFTLLSIAASNPTSEIAAYDVVAAFLGTPMRNGKLLYIRMDKRLIRFITVLYPNLTSFIHTDGSLYFKVEKYIYGLAEAAREFNLRLDSVLRKIGFTSLIADPCVYQRETKDGIHRVAIHVDDIFSNAPSKAARMEFEREISKEFEIKPKYNDISYLGMSIKKLKSGNIMVSQDGFTKELLKKFKISSNGKITSPCDDSIVKCHEDEELLANPKEFISLIMSIMYLARMTRPDLLFTVNVLSTKSTKPTVKDYNNALRVLKYLCYTKDARIILKQGDMKARIFCDASYLLHPDGFGHSGILITVGGNFVYARSVKQHLQTRSSTESELIALEEGSTYVVWIRHLLQELGYTQKTPTSIYQDNLSAKTIAEQGGNFKRTKHLVGRFAYLKERIENRELIIKYKNTKEMIADLLTKGLNYNATNTLTGYFNLRLRQEVEK